MSSMFPSSMADSPESKDGDKDFTLTYRHWLVVSLLVLLNVAIFGCALLAIFGKIHFGG